MSVSNQGKIARNKVLVMGASGLLGVAAIEKFLSAGWEVVGVSRRKSAHHALRHTRRRGSGVSPSSPPGVRREHQSKRWW